MKIHDCLLDDKNGFVLGSGSRLMDKIASAGKRHLWGPRVGGVVDTVVIHYMSAVNAVSDPALRYDLGHVLEIFCDYGVSCHYLINRGGKVLRLVPEEEKAWHCGGSIMPAPDNRTGVNEFSIGIELMATADSGFTKAQYAALRQLCLDIESRHGRKMAFVGHDRIAGERAVAMGLRKDVKADPGPLFDWSVLAP